MAVEAAAAPARWSRSYPPLALLAVAVVIAAFVLPSSLNLPQSNPSTVLEYAPVPPDDDQPPDVQGNLSSLGLGSSNTLGVGGKPPPPSPPPNRSTSDRPARKNCFGTTPPRQTEDPMAPPCVPFFEGDNFGATFQGVSKDEITVLIYVDTGSYNFEYSPSTNKYLDLNDPPRPKCAKKYPSGDTDRDKCDYMGLRIARAMNYYFNDRFQTYNRTVHYYMYFTSAATGAARRQDAQDNWDKLHPFAVLDQATFNGHNEDYDDAMASRHVLVFTQESALRSVFFQKNQPQGWGFWPDVEHWARMYSSYVCAKVANKPVAHTTDPNLRGNRKLGILFTTDDGEPGLKLFHDLVVQQIRPCVSEPPVEANFSHSGFVVDGSDPGSEQAEAAAKFKSNDVTTVLYIGGIEGRFSQEADRLSYYPEIVFAGDLDVDANVAARYQNANVWRNAWGTSFQLRMDRPEDTPGYRAYKAADPSGQLDEARYANDAYRDHFYLFQAIQVAGPDVTPESVDKGFHAIPAFKTSSPYIAACFFDTGDYTCVKDATELWWDPAGASPGDPTQPGCYHLVNEGARFQAGAWPSVDEVFNPKHPCTGYEGARRLRVS